MGGDIYVCSRNSDGASRNPRPVVSEVEYKMDKPCLTEVKMVCFQNWPISSERMDVAKLFLGRRATGLMHCSLQSDVRSTTITPISCRVAWGKLASRSHCLHAWSKYKTSSRSITLLREHMRSTKATVSRVTRLFPCRTVRYKFPRELVLR
jgi:hypothetical protein